MKYVFKRLVKRVLLPLELTAEASAAGKNTLIGRCGNTFENSWNRNNITNNFKISNG